MPRSTARHACPHACALTSLLAAPLLSPVGLVGVGAWCWAGQGVPGSAARLCCMASAQVPHVLWHQPLQLGCCGRALEVLLRKRAAGALFAQQRVSCGGAAPLVCSGRLIRVPGPGTRLLRSGLWFCCASRCCIPCSYHHTMLRAHLLVVLHRDLLHIVQNCDGWPSRHQLEMTGKDVLGSILHTCWGLSAGCMGGRGQCCTAASCACPASLRRCFVARLALAAMLACVCLQAVAATSVRLPTRAKQIIRQPASEAAGDDARDAARAAGGS